MFVARGKEDALVTKNMVPGEAVYGEKRISVEVRRICSVLQIVRALDKREYLVIIRDNFLNSA